jgi:hypothetical protein
MSIRAPHNAELVLVTWGWTDPDRDKLHHTPVNLRWARARGVADDEAIRRILGIRYGTGVASAAFVEILKVEPVAA